MSPLRGWLGDVSSEQSRSDDSWRRVRNDLSPLRGYWRCLDHAILSD
ncbi:hypothetical protein RISK_001756 [Rhodopirellula islandica]|uniref:Uncharacterized protein n=1 Tax=Rhodopirellula islandica TaxID=595434 RepID=A0A0J1BHA2_RHOIS|nr:hypothetical protein RISK_001756 [Rhodopirellula islandica]